MNHEYNLKLGTQGCWCSLTFVEVEKTYDGRILEKPPLERTHTKVQIVQTVFRLDISVMEVPKNTMNGEYLELVVRWKRFKDCTNSSALDENGCKIFKTFYSFHSLRSLYPFLSEPICRIQCNTLFRLWDLCIQNDSCLKWKKTERQYEFGCEGLRRVRKIHDFHGSGLVKRRSRILKEILRKDQFSTMSWL